MRRFIQYIPFLTLVVLIFGCSTSKRIPINNDDKTSVSIIPKPQILTVNGDKYKLPKENSIFFTGSTGLTVDLLQELLQKKSLNATIVNNTDPANFKLIADSTFERKLGKEGYILDINNKGIVIKAASDTGLYYGLQSLKQLLLTKRDDITSTSENIWLPQLHIQDSPKYSWRGSMIDIARSYFGIEYLKAHLNRMSLYKMNRLHLHLTDDQGWRLELKSKPQLTQIGGKGSVKNGRSGYLTIEEYKKLQTYAKSRHIVIIPEIDLPGHSYSALVSYPELNCENLSNLNPKMATPPDLFNGYKVGWSKLCLSNPETLNFVKDVYKEVSELTEGPWIHIGGDEINDELYKSFVIKADSIVRSYGKISIGWEEVSKAKVSPELISQRWNGKTTPLNKSKVIESICTSFYLDHANVSGQENTNNWCKKSGVSLEDIYNFDDKENEIIGVEAPVWTELVVTDSMLDNRLWPRLTAVAEIGWSDAHNDYSDFKNRLKEHKSLLESLDIHYYPSPELNWNNSTNREYLKVNKTTDIN